MVSLRLGNAGKCSIRVASTIFKIPPNFLWVDEIIETQLAIVALNGATSAPPAERKAERLVLVVTCEDIKIEGPQTPQSVTNEVGSQAVLDIVRVSMSTVAMVPTAPLQHYSIVADQVRVLFAKKSPPFSAKTEHNFLEVRGPFRFLPSLQFELSHLHCPPHPHFPTSLCCSQASEP